MSPTSHRKTTSCLSFALSAAVASVFVCATQSARATSYYWDNAAGSGFGSAGGTWSASASLWSTSSTGAGAPAGNVVTTTADTLNFGTSTTALGGGTITISGTVNAATLVVGSASGSIALSGGTIDMGTTAGSITTGANLSISGILTGSAGLTKAGGSTAVLTLSGANTFSGATKISAGLLSLTNTSGLALQNSALDTTNSINGNATSGLKVTGTTTLTLGGLTGSKNLALVFTTGSGAYSNMTALTLNPGTGVTNAYSGVIANGAAGMTLTKTGLGTQTLSGANSYTGGTTVSAGTLLVNNTIDSGTGTNTVSVSSEATLGGSGVIAGAVNVSTGGFIAPGNSSGNLTLNSGLDLDGTFLWELSALSTANPGTDFDILTITGGNADVTGATLGLNLGANAPAAVPFWEENQTWAGILNNTGAGSLTGAFAAIDNSSWASFGAFTTTYTGNDVNLVWTAVPEPTTSVLAGLLMGAGLLRRRRA